MAGADPARPPPADPGPVGLGTPAPARSPGLLARLLAGRPVGQVLGFSIGAMFILAVAGIGL
ncbi:MAG: hypothetical protein QOE27_2585, partial [Solirubrobacteraceae bacterium]|nr:hypothetical protein [Solirubrobacteraceae bacterium]